MEMILKFLGNLFRLLVGLIFIVSGFSKAVDPLGAMYKFEEYFENVFHWEWALPYALPFAFAMSIVELMAGLSLFFNFKIRIGSLVALLFMLFFTPLTYSIAVNNSVTDCGCFGDFIVLDNWATFYKNLIILGPTLFVFLYRKKFVPFLANSIQWLMTGVFLLSSIGFSYYCIEHLPVIDFRPYKVGANIREGMKEIPDKMKHSYKFENIKDGSVKVFGNDAPWTDSTNWKYVDMISEVVEKGVPAKIKNFEINSLDGESYVDTILNNPNYTLLIVSYDLYKGDLSAHQNIGSFVNKLKTKSVAVYGLTASYSGDIEKFVNNLGYDIQYLTGDDKELKTMIRSNPGMILLKNGIVIANWHHNDFPSYEKFEKTYLPKKEKHQ